MHSLRLKQFATTYSEAFDRHRTQPSEATLRMAYELGREAIANELSVLDVAGIHHQTLGVALERTPLHEGRALTRSAGEFFQEVLSAAEMVRRGYREAHDARLEARQRAAVVQRMSKLLSDPSLAGAQDHTIAEVLQLVAEHARELSDADEVIAQLDRPFRRCARTPDAQVTQAASDDATLIVPLLALDGSPLGSLELRRSRGRFTSNESASVAQLVEMAAAAIDRALLYRRH
jgi:hypothetical protein